MAVIMHVDRYTLHAMHTRHVCPEFELSIFLVNDRSPSMNYCINQDSYIHYSIIIAAEQISIQYDYFHY